MERKIIIALMTVCTIMLIADAQTVESLQGRLMHKAALVVDSKSSPYGLDGDNADGAAEIDETESVDNNVEDLLNIGMSMEREGKYEEAVDAYGQVLEIDPYHAEALFHLTLSSLHSGDTLTAHRGYRKLRSLDPQMADKLHKKAVQIASLKNSKYLLQVGAYRNIHYADEMFDRVKEHYMNGYVEKMGDLYKVRILGIKSKEEALSMIQEVKDTLGIDSFMLPAR